MLAVAAQRALAYSLLELPLAAADECDGTEPPLGDLLADARDTEPVPASTPTPNSKNVGPPSNIHLRGRGNVYIEGVWGVLRRGGFPTWA